MAMVMGMAMAYFCVFLRLQTSESQPHRLDQKVNFSAAVTFMHRYADPRWARVGLGFF